MVIVFPGADPTLTPLSPVIVILPSNVLRNDTPADGGGGRGLPCRKNADVKTIFVASIVIPSKRQLFADWDIVTFCAPMFFTISVFGAPKKTLRVQFVILAVMGCVGALNRIASLFPPVSAVNELYFNTDPSKLTTGVRVAPLCEMMRGARVVPAAVFKREQLRTVRLPVISMSDPSTAAETS
jgi:hypothetical protein